jgi:hypothetical protein
MLFQISSALRPKKIIRIGISGTRVSGHYSELPARSKSDVERIIATKFAVPAVGIIAGIGRSILR